MCIEKNVAFHHADQAQLSHQTKSITCNPFNIACTASALEFAHLASLVREPFFCLFSHPLLTTSEPVACYVSEPVACYAIVTSESVACSVLSSTSVRSPPLLEPVFPPTFCPIVTSDSVACSVYLFSYKTLTLLVIMARMIQLTGTHAKS